MQLYWPSKLTNVLKWVILPPLSLYFIIFEMPAQAATWWYVRAPIGACQVLHTFDIMDSFMTTTCHSELFHKLSCNVLPCVLFAKLIIHRSIELTSIVYCHRSCWLPWLAPVYCLDPSTVYISCKQNNMQLTNTILNNNYLYYKYTMQWIMI